MSAAQIQPIFAVRASWLLTGLYWTAWPLIHSVFWCVVQSAPDSSRDSGALYLWLGVICGQIGASQMWRYREGWGSLLAGLIALSGVSLAAYLLSDFLFESQQNAWLALLLLLLGCKCAWWSLLKPEQTGKQRVQPSNGGSFSIANCLAASFWVAILLWAIQVGKFDLVVSLSLLAAFGGLSLLLAIHRFAFQQLFWPDPNYWPGPQATRLQQTGDALGILFLLLVFNGFVAWSLWQFYGAGTEAWLILCLCWSAALWQAFDLTFERMTRFAVV